MGRRGKGEGSIHQRQDGLWAAELHLGYVDGKRRRKTVYGKTKQAVAKKPKELQRLHGLGVDLTAERQTIEQFLNDWLEHTVKEHNEESTYRSYADNTRLHIVPYIGHLYLDKLTPAHVQMMLNELPNKGLSACSAAYVQAILRSALSLAEEWGYVPRNVAKLAKAPRQEQRMIEPLTLEQACAILEVVHGHRLATLYQVALSLGLRRGEMLDLRWRDVNFTDKSLHVKQGKTEASKRTLALPDELVDALRGHWERQQQERLTLGIN
jgi:integrase